MQLTCPCCGEQFPLEAGMADDEGKRLAALLFFGKFTQRQRQNFSFFYV